MTDLVPDLDMSKALEPKTLYPIIETSDLGPDWAVTSRRYDHLMFQDMTVTPVYEITEKRVVDEVIEFRHRKVLGSSIRASQVLAPGVGANIKAACLLAKELEKTLPMLRKKEALWYWEGGTS